MRQASPRRGSGESPPAFSLRDPHRPRKRGRHRGRSPLADPPPGRRASAKGSDPGAVAKTGLRYGSDREPGIARRRLGRGFTYRRADGRIVRDAATLARIRALAIPPAWRDVWICTDALGHVQATGRDARGRKQYRYHARWRDTRDRGKFERVAEFASRLPALRRRVARDLRRAGLPREKVLATAIAVLERTLIRVGNDEYARSNGSYGLTTLRDTHVRLAAGRAHFVFKGKSGLRHEAVVDDARLARIVRRCQALPGQQLFQFEDADGRVQDVDSSMVNEYLREATGGDYTAKDFRTWGGTLRAVEVLAATPHPRPPSKRALDRCLVAAVKAVAEHLRNTPAVCRGSYIHPVVLTAWCDGTLHRTLAGAKTPRQVERAAQRLLRASSRR